MRLIITVFALVVISFSAFSQDKDKQAREYYQIAKKAFDKGSFEECITNLYKVEDLLGKSNIRVLPLLIRSYDTIQAWTYVVKDFERYKSLLPDTNLIEYKEISRINIRALEKVENENSDFRNLKYRAATISDYNNYLMRYPYGAYRDEVSWMKAEKVNSLDSYLGYLEKYPAGKYYMEATKRGAEIDKNAYDKAVNEGTHSSLNSYLGNFPRGSYRDEITPKIAELTESEKYAEVLSTREYEKYLENYPNGKYASKVHDLYKELLYKNGLDLYENKDYDGSKQKFSLFIDNYSSDTRVATAQKMIQKCESKSNQSGFEALTFLYDTENSLTIGYEDYKLNKVGGYINFRLHTVFFPMLVYGDNTINNEGETNAGNVNILNESRTGGIGVSGGLTFKVFYPLWIGVGAGVSYYPVLIKAYDNVLEENIWLKHTDQSAVAIVPQLSFNLKASKKLLVKAGILYHEGVVGQFGIGFKL
ncbi:MAG TPA: hypothetical protein VHO46_04445 [Bacteroidales bacterium]|nr:hypothetical protein [Bacteroidales bacterium]